MRGNRAMHWAASVLGVAACACQGQSISGTGTYKGAGPGWDRGKQTTMHCGSNPESWVRGSATLDKQTGALTITVELETDSIVAGPKGRVVITLRDAQQKAIYVITSDEVGTGGRQNKAAIRDFNSTVTIPVPIAMRTESLFLDAECTGHVDGLFNLNLQLAGKEFEAFSSGSSLEVNSGLRKPGRSSIWRPRVPRAFRQWGHHNLPPTCEPR